MGAAQRRIAGINRQPGECRKPRDTAGREGRQPHFSGRGIDVDGLNRNEHVATAVLLAEGLEAGFEVADPHRRAIDNQVLDPADRDTIGGDHSPAADVGIAISDLQGVELIEPRELVSVPDGGLARRALFIGGRPV